MTTLHLSIPTTTVDTPKITGLIETLWSANTMFTRLRAIVNAANGDIAAFTTEFGFANTTDAQTFIDLFNDAYNRWTEAPGGGPNALTYMMNRMI